MKTPTRKLPESTWRELRTAHASGLGLRELARNMGIPAGTILARSKREGWARQIREAKALVCSSPAPATPVATAAAASMAERGQRHLQRMAGVVEKTLPHVEGMEPGAILDRVDELEKLDKIARRTFGISDGVPGLNVMVNVAMLGMMSPAEMRVIGAVAGAD